MPDPDFASMHTNNNEVIKCPRLRFRYSRAASWYARWKLKRALLNSLLAKGSVTKSYSPAIAGFVQINKKDFGIALGRDRYDRKFMIACVVPLAMMGFSKKRMLVPQDLLCDLVAICKCMDKEIRATQGVESVHWYFEWLDYRSQTVSSLDELPWRESMGSDSIG